jgi:hypothetical protein
MSTDDIDGAVTSSPATASSCEIVSISTPPSSPPLTYLTAANTLSPFDNDNNIEAVLSCLCIDKMFANRNNSDRFPLYPQIIIVVGGQKCSGCINN